MVLHSNYYQGQYQDVMGTGITGRFWAFIHKSMARNLICENDIVLELGAGNGEFYRNVSPTCKLYLETDIERRDDRLSRMKTSDLSKSGKLNLQLDAQNLEGLPDNCVDVVIATCLLMHLSDPDLALREWKRVLKVGGKMVVYIPAEPGLGLRMTRYLTTRRKFKKVGINQAGSHWTEHIQHYPRIIHILNSVFGKSCSVKKFPFNFFVWDFNLFAIAHIQNTPEENPTNGSDL
jgi:ubiquinone/menaquinone biosynthesis C-methylase UbiE